MAEALATAAVPATAWRPRRRRARLPGFWFLLPAALVLLGVYAGPMLYALKASFTQWVLVMPGSEDDPAGLSNYADVLASAGVLAPRCG